MKIELKEISIAEIVCDYVDNDENGVSGYGGKLNIRPQYQREFVYDEKKRNAVIETIMKGFPLNSMYWAVNDDGTYELLDGQQRTISFCQYVCGNFSVDQRTFLNLTRTEQSQILQYKVMVYFCEGTDKEKLDWFKVINIAGEKLTDQELRNAVYTGPWLADAKRYFSKSGCAAQHLSKDYVSGSAIRQELLETALDWINDGDIAGYMSAHQHDPNANALWNFYRNVMEWVQQTFKVKRKEMKSVEWGPLYKKFGDKLLDAADLETRIKDLMMDDDITSRKGIYPYVLTGDERHLNIRIFSPAMRRKAYERQNGHCALCDKFVDEDFMEADHITPWSQGGRTDDENCQMLCRDCNRRKSAK